MNSASARIPLAALHGLFGLSMIGALLCISCGTSSVPSTTSGSACTQDADCDPGDNCVNGTCQGSSAGGGSGGSSGGAGGGSAGGIAGGTGGGSAGGSAGGSGGGAAGGIAGGSGGGSGTDSCTHSECTPGTNLVDGCSACATTVCAADAYCCATAWNARCVTEAESECTGDSLSCSGGGAGGGTAGGAGGGTAGGAGGGTAGGAGGGTAGGAGGGTAGGAGGGSGVIGPTGGTVDLLDFVMTGDTRPPACDQNSAYPTAVHTQIIGAMAKLVPQFGLDLGDHMYVCGQNLANAQLQMGDYLSGLTGFKPYFAMTMGNHECEDGKDCSANATDVNYSTFMAALNQVSRQTNPNYALQIQTRLGRATLVVVADNSFSVADQQWLQTTLADADENSKYTIIAKHHPITGSRAGPAAVTTLIAAHKYSLLLMAHNHDYEHSGSSVPTNGRGVICGLGGANTSHTGFCRVQQTAAGDLQFTQYDINGNPGDTWTVAPQ